LAQLTEAEIQAKIDDINVQIASLVSSASGGANVKTLNMQVQSSSRYDMLMKDRMFWENKLQDIPTTEYLYMTHSDESDPV